MASPFISSRGERTVTSLIGPIYLKLILWLVETPPPLISDQIVLYSSPYLYARQYRDGDDASELAAMLLLVAPKLLLLQSHNFTISCEYEDYDGGCQ